jgi:hypothetical protein
MTTSYNIPLSITNYNENVPTLRILNFIAKESLQKNNPQGVLKTYKKLAFMANFEYTLNYTHNTNSSAPVFEKTIRRSVQVPDVDNAPITAFLGKHADHIDIDARGYQTNRTEWVKSLLPNNNFESLKSELRKMIYEQINPPTATIAFLTENDYGNS